MNRVPSGACVRRLDSWTVLGITKPVAPGNACFVQVWGVIAALAGRANAKRLKTVAAVKTTPINLAILFFIDL
jgi:hypothetical protein